MKIEMGESLFYSWLRHVKECQVVQTNWKVSSQWELLHEDEIQNIMASIDNHFSEKCGYKVFKQNGSFRQVIRQGECDAIGICVEEGVPRYYAVEVAFHGAGLNYGTRDATVMKVVEKCTRAALCIYGYMGSKEGEVVFASPKINNAVIADLSPCIEDINTLFRQEGFQFSFRIIANGDFNESVLQPILLISDGIADTSELFVRSYQMCAMFAEKSIPKNGERRLANRASSESKPPYIQLSVHDDDGAYKELKVGQIARSILRKMLEEGAATEDEIEYLQQSGYSRRVFHLNYPLLARVESGFEKARYYSSPLMIRGISYVLCSQWFETPANNDRPFLLKWIKEHADTISG